MQKRLILFYFCKTMTKKSHMFVYVCVNTYDFRNAYILEEHL